VSFPQLAALHAPFFRYPIGLFGSNCRHLLDFDAIGLRRDLGHHEVGQIGDAAGIAPLVVVPGNDLGSKHMQLSASALRCPELTRHLLLDQNAQS
jgi:hypothetical protein